MAQTRGLRIGRVSERSGCDSDPRRRNPAAWSVSPQHDDSTLRSAAAAIASVPMRHAQAAAAAPGTARSREAAMTPAAAATRRRSTHAACDTAAPAAPRCAAVREISATISAVVRQGGRTGGNGKARHSAGGFDETWMQTVRAGGPLGFRIQADSDPRSGRIRLGYYSDVLLGCHTNGSFR